MELEHTKYLQAALAEARKAYLKNEVPIGAIVVDAEGKIIGRGSNQTHTKKDGRMHGGVMAIKQAQKRLGDWRLEGAKMYITLEPCLMCLGAIGNARIEQVTYWLTDPLFGSVGSKLSGGQLKKLFPKLRCQRLKDDGTIAGLMKSFFQNLRK